MLKVQGEPHLVRTSTGAIQNNNQDDFLAYIAKRNAANDTKNRLEALERETKELKQMLGAILQLLQDDGK